jgi:reactive intermediate/imine deaminase
VELVTISSPAAPKAIGPYVQAVAHSGVLYCSGSLAIDPRTGELDNGDVTAEVTRSLKNLGEICTEAGTSLERALRLTIYTTCLESFSEINAAYAEFFNERHPARTTIGVAELPMGAVVEIDAVVALAEAEGMSVA